MGALSVPSQGPGSKAIHGALCPLGKEMCHASLLVTCLSIKRPSSWLSCVTRGCGLQHLSQL